MRQNFMKSKLLKRVAAFVMAVTVVLTGMSSTAYNVQAASTTDRLPITCYTLNGRVTTYTNSACTNKSGYIDSVDLTKITAIYANQGSVKVQYPTSRGTKTAYAKMSGFFANPSFHTATGKTGQKLTAYRRSTGSSTIGSVYATDVCIITGTSNGRTQMIYPTSSGYKLGWVNGSYNFAGSSGNVSAQNKAGFQWPLTDTYVCGNNWSEYYSVKGRDHLGVDIKSSKGDKNIYAAGSGTVVQTGWNSSNGNTITIKHTISGKTVYSFYGHLSSVNVAKGAPVTKGQKIGVIGNTGGSSTGTHLHFAFTTQCSAGTWGYGTSFSNGANAASYQGYTFYNPSYIISNGRLP